MASHTKEGILYQTLVAFGQGTGRVRVEQQAATALFERFRKRMSDGVVEQWEADKDHALERIRIMGSLACQKMVSEARTAIIEKDVMAAAEEVERASLTNFCKEPEG